MERRNGRATAQPESPYPDRRQARVPTCRQEEMKKMMKRKMRVFSIAERRSMAHRQGERRWSLPDESRREWKL